MRWRFIVSLISLVEPGACLLRRNEHSKHDQKGSLRTRHRLAAACTGYVAGTLAATPLDVIKTRLQAGAVATYRGAFAATVQIFRQEGLRGFYRGLLPSLMMAPGTVIQYTLYDTLRARAIAPVAAAVLAAVVDITIRTPMERIKTYTQAGLLSAPAATEFRGLLGRSALLWSGYGATLLRDIPYCVIYWLSYDTLRSTLAFDVDAASGSGKYAKGFAAGFLAGAFAATAATPADVVKTRIQTSPPGLTPLAALELILRQNGVSGLFVGLPTRLIRIPVYSGIFLATHECIKSFFGRNKNDVSDTT